MSDSLSAIRDDEVRYSALCKYYGQPEQQLYGFHHKAIEEFASSHAGLPTSQRYRRSRGHRTDFANFYAKKVAERDQENARRKARFKVLNEFLSKDDLDILKAGFRKDNDDL